MAQTPESKVKATIRAVLDKYRVYYAMPMGTGYGNAGTPDFLCCYRGRFIAIEAKAGPGRTTALQKRALQKIEEAGGISLVINETNMQHLVAALDVIQALE